MNILVFSDTHNDPDSMLEIVRQEKNLAACFHLGDGWHDAQLLADQFPGLRVYRVRGNCDYGAAGPTEGLVPFGGLLFLYTHGNAYHVKHGLDELWQAAKARRADAALYGHTHTPYYEYRNGVHLFNPGSLSFPRSGPPTYGRITIHQNRPAFAICPYTP